MHQTALVSWDRSPPLPIPFDILLDVVHHLPIQAILALRQVVYLFRDVPLFTHFDHPDQ